ncbi:LysE family translocator [Cereibacter sphaeroides]|uniref:LysE family translocator n=1 Tax=Cereibacter sphaeroides TaxID=1063 RepID=UPI000191C69E|nr:LysE family translocator [Cereibacter sphaeroides]ACM02925.1 Lysine exporter protein (LYSE/YGGA) precursor [Cereibacter sphaeroides KD131]RHZ97681.1 LysE family translocator [Cereibacter sphaeroides]
MSPEFLLTAFIVCAAPGIGVLYTLSTTLGGGIRAGLLAVLGCTLATGVHLVAAMAGLAAVLHASAVLFQGLKIAGVAYLLWMAWATLQEHGGLRLEAAAPEPAVRIVRRGILLNLLNPKLPLFFMAFLPQFIPAGSPEAPRLLIELGLGFTAMTAATFLGYVALAALSRGAVLSSPRLVTWLRRLFAASFAGLGARLAFERT